MSLKGDSVDGNTKQLSAQFCKAPFGIPVTIRLGLGFPAKIVTQPKNSIWRQNPTKFTFGNPWQHLMSDQLPYINIFNDSTSAPARCAQQVMLIVDNVELGIRPN